MYVHLYTDTSLCGTRSVVTGDHQGVALILDNVTMLHQECIMRKRVEEREEREMTTQQIKNSMVVPLLFLARTCIFVMPLTDYSDGPNLDEREKIVSISVAGCS